MAGQAGNGRFSKRAVLVIQEHGRGLGGDAVTESVGEGLKHPLVKSAPAGRVAPLEQTPQDVRASDQDLEGVRKVGRRL